VRRWVWSRNLVNEEALAHWGLSRQIKKNQQCKIRIEYTGSVSNKTEKSKRCHLRQISLSLWGKSVQNLAKCDAACEKTEPEILYKDICILCADRARDNELWHRCILCSGSSPAECGISVTRTQVHLWLLLLTEQVHSGGIPIKRRKHLNSYF